MNNSLPLSMTFCWLCFLLLGWIGNGSSTPAIAQTPNDTTGIVQVPINTDHSVILWKGTEMWQTRKHEGTVNLSEGYLLLDNGQIIGGHIIADMNSIAITDIPEHETVPRRRLRNHLKSDDFFHVDEYPTAEFKITQTETFKSDSLRVLGDLSIRDVTKSISFVASKKPDQNSTLILSASFTIDRFEYNISYQGSYWSRLTSILDNNLVDADISLSIELITASIE